MRRLSAFILFILVAPTLAQERTHDITPDDYASVNTITEIAVSPDGKQVAYTLATWDRKADNRKTDLWVVDTDGKGKPRQLTKDRSGYSNPKWSADGTAIYTLASRGAKAKTQVWKVPLDGDPAAMTRMKDGVTGFDYAPKADALFYTIDAKAEPNDDFASLRKRFDKPEYANGKRTVSELHEIEPTDNAEPRKLYDAKRYIREFVVTQDGKRIAMVTAIDDTVVKSEGESRVDVWENGKIVTPPTDVYRAKAASPHAWLESLAWNPDGTRFAFCAIFDAYPTEIIIGQQKNGTWTTERMPRRSGEHVQGYGSPLRWNEFGALAYHGEKAGSVYPVTFNPASGVVGSAQTWSGKVVFGTARAGGQSVVLVALKQGEFPDLYAVDSSGLNPRRLTDINPHTKSWKLPTVRHVSWKADDGTEVGGPLELPHGYKKGDKPLPLVVAIHGGPTTSSPNDLRFDPHNGRLYFAAKGYAVLCPNYRGSTGYGDKFVTDLIGKENDIEVKDILAGIQHLIHEGIADPERIAVMGWSNGGYLTNCLITLKDPPVRIKAASSGAGIVDTVAEWGFNDEPAYPFVFKKGKPWETPEIYHKTSPTYQLQYAKTPTLIHVGGSDVRCPPGHSRMLHRALNEYLKVPTELIVYPGEPHGLGKLSNRIAKMEWDLAWFEKYMK